MHETANFRYRVVPAPAVTAGLSWGADRQVMTIDRGKRGAGENPNQLQLMARRPTLDPDQPSLHPLRQKRPPGASHVRGEAFRKQYSQAHLDCVLTKPILLIFSEVAHHLELRLGLTEDHTRSLTYAVRTSCIKDGNHRSPEPSTFNFRSPPKSRLDPKKGATVRPPLLVSD